MSILPILHDTSSSVQDFTQGEAVASRGTKQEKRISNPLSLQKQLELITEILQRCFVVQKNNQIELMFDLGHSKMQRVEKNFKNFKEVMSSAFQDKLYHFKLDKDRHIVYETINLPKLFEIIKTRTIYSLHESYSIFHKQNKIIIDSQKNELTVQKKIDYEFAGAQIDKNIFTEIVSAISEHWQGHIPTILDHIVAGQYVTDKKDIWLAILAKSNFGKSKLFKWMSEFGGTAFIDYADMIKKGPSDIPVEKILDKLCLVIDEVLGFRRELYKIEEYMLIRPMREHTVEVPIGSRILLSADGGSFNADHAEEQEVNRVALIDLRYTENSQTLGGLEISKKYGKYTIEKVMELYLYNELIKRITEYELLNNAGKANKADEIIAAINAKFRRKAKNFFEALEDSLYEILADPKETLDNKHFELLQEALVRIETRNKKGWIIQRASVTVKKIVSHYDDSLEYELQFKAITQIAKQIRGFEDGKHRLDNLTQVRGLYIPDRVEEVSTEYLDKDGNLTDKDGKLLF